VDGDAVVAPAQHGPDDALLPAERQHVIRTVTSADVAPHVTSEPAAHIAPYDGAPVVLGVDDPDVRETVLSFSRGRAGRRAPRRRSRRTPYGAHRRAVPPRRLSGRPASTAARRRGAPPRGRTAPSAPRSRARSGRADARTRPSPSDPLGRGQAAQARSARRPPPPVLPRDGALRAVCRRQPPQGAGPAQRDAPALCRHPGQASRPPVSAARGPRPGRGQRPSRASSRRARASGGPALSTRDAWRRPVM
jgi:hypothetical protein